MQANLCSDREKRIRASTLCEDYSHFVQTEVHPPAPLPSSDLIEIVVPAGVVSTYFAAISKTATSAVS
jgi:hypothetical protein